jgi:S-DNA-T family DNA segregation ATPase FtsK/SpoIIIE
MVDVVLEVSRCSGERDVTLVLQPGGAVGDLAGAVGAALGSRVSVDGTSYDADVHLDEVPLHNGSRIVVDDAIAVAGGRHAVLSSRLSPVVDVRVIGGLDAGRRFVLPPGRYVVGRAGAGGVDLELGSETVSARHALLVVAPDGMCVIRDLGSRNGVRIDGSFASGDALLAVGAVVRLGAVEIIVSAPAADDRPRLRAPRGAALVTFDRMPRATTPATTRALRAPAPPVANDYQSRFSWATVLAPLAIAALMLVLMPGNRMFLIFMLLSPVLALANWFEDRRRARKQRAAKEEEFSQAIAHFRGAVSQAHAEEVRRRRASLCDLAESIRRANAPSAMLWERRPAHDDFGEVSLGSAQARWRPALEGLAEEGPEAAAVLADFATLPEVPVTVGLRSGRVIGLVGDRARTLALARALVVQAAVHHGPADLPIAVLTEPARVDDWDWAKWLPHVRTDDGARLLAATGPDRQELVAALLSPPEDSDPRLHLVVMDADGITAGRSCPARELLAGAGARVGAIVIADRLDQLPAMCTDVVEIVHPDGLARVTEPAAGTTTDDVLVAGLSAVSARETAIALARYEDADLIQPGADLPDCVAFTTLPGVTALDPAALAASWALRRTGSLAATIGVLADGPLVVDLVVDGPHGLIAGTTGSGKSELLRTIVASLAATYSPRDVTFVLIDYKGGAAFAECAKLPHTVGLVTDLDDRLGSRALVCLEAELRHRERILRDAGVSDLTGYAESGEQCGPLPRLVVAIDEFATLATELPDFIDALVGIAQRGRSLGVHLLLATQRPSGAVKDNIRANTNLRIALRVQDAADSADVLDVPLAAHISRHRPGRGFLRLGAGEITAFQSALVTGPADSDDDRPAPVTVATMVFGPRAVRDDGARPSGPARRTTLADLVAAASQAALAMQLPPARRPWPEPLPSELSLADVRAAPVREHGWSAVLGLVDEPALQRQGPFTWESSTGGLLLYGAAGSGTSTALATAAISLAGRYSPADLHIYILDFGAQSLAPLAALPHVGAVVHAGERERQERLIRRLREDMRQRQELFRRTGASRIEEHLARCTPAEHAPGVVLMIDGWSAFASSFDDMAGTAIRDDLARLIADGPALGIYTMITADRAMGIPSSIASSVTGKLVFRMADPHDFSAFGIPVRELPAFVPGRAIDVAGRREVQVARAHADALAEAVARLKVRPHAIDRLPQPVLTLPDEVALADIADASGLGGEEWWLPVGIGDKRLEPAGFRMAEGDHVLIAGAARGGKSTLLCAIAEATTRHRPEVHIVAIAGARSPLASTDHAAAVFDPRDVAAAVDAVLAADGATLLLVDDAERFDDDGAIRRLIAARRPGDHVVAAGRADALRASYGHWTEEVRRSRQGIVLKPQPEIDGDLWGMLLPRRGPGRFGAGRGYLVADGEAELVQVAR